MTFILRKKGEVWYSGLCVFLWKLLRLKSTVATSFCVQQEKGEHGLLREASQGEREGLPSPKGGRDNIAQSKLNQKALKNLGLKRDKPKELKEKKDESKKKASKPSGKEGMGTVNPTENPKKVGKRREKEKRKTTAQSNSFKLIFFAIFKKTYFSN